MPSTSPDEGCRVATPDDMPRLVALVEMAIAELSAGRGGEVWARRHARTTPYADGLATDLDHPDRRVLVGTLDGNVLAYGVAHVEPVPDGGLLGVVDDLYTEPDARQLGLGEMMMQALVDWCTERGCFGVDSLALPGDRHTKNFFEGFGLVARALIVHRSLR